MRTDLLKAFPEFNLVKDSDLYEKSLLVYQDAIQTGGWKLADLDIIPFTLLITNCTVSYRFHVRAVTQLAIKSAEIMTRHYSHLFQINMNFVILGGLLHDIGKLLEYSRDENGFIQSETGRLIRHPFSGAGLAMKHGLPDEIINIIAMHSKEGDLGYRCPEARIIHHCDLLNFELINELQK